MAVILVPFSVLQRGMKIQGFDQIQQFFRRNTHQSFKIFLSEKKKLGATCTLRLYRFLIYSKFINSKSLAFHFFTQQNFSPSLSPFFSIFISDFHKYTTRQKNNHIYSHRITLLSLRNSLTT